ERVMPDLRNGLIKSVIPGVGVDGGEVVIDCDGYDTSDYSACKVMFGAQRGRLVSASPSRVIVAVPDYGIGAKGEELRISSAMAESSVPFKLGVKLAENLHPVANPAIDRDDGSIYVTLSGQRGQKVPVSIYKIAPDDTVSPFISDIVNPTGMAFSREGALYVTSRYDGA